MTEDQTTQEDDATIVAEAEAEDNGQGFMFQHGRLIQDEDETYEEYSERRRMINRILRYVEKQRNGYRPATRLVSGGLRDKMQDVYTNRETKLAPGEKDRRRRGNAIARKSRKQNRAA